VCRIHPATLHKSDGKGRIGCSLFAPSLGFLSARTLPGSGCWNPEDEAFQKALHAVHNQHQPNRVLIGNHGPVEEFAKKQTPEGNGSPLVYVCSGSACKIPTIDPKQFQSYLKAPPPLSQNTTKED